MSNNSILTSLFAFALVVFAACDRNTVAPIPPCPDCWDEKMLCVENTCQCPEGNIETWLNMYSNDEKDVIPHEGRKFCIQPHKLTFMAHFPRFECIDTFAFRFLTEPLEVTPQTQILSTTSIETLVPEKWSALPPGLILSDDPEGLFVGIVSLYPTHGTNFFGCVDYDLNGAVDGSIGRISFRGYFTHPDTISGHLLFEGAAGSKAHLENYQLEGIKLIRTVPY